MIVLSLHKLCGVVFYVGWRPTSKIRVVFSSGTENVFPWDVLPLLAI